MKKVSISVEGLTITIEGDDGDSPTLPLVLEEIEGMLLAWGYRFKGNLDIVDEA